MIKIKYVFVNKKDGDIQDQSFFIEQVENGESKIYIESMIKDGYTLLFRSIVGEED